MHHVSPLCRAIQQETIELVRLGCSDSVPVSKDCLDSAFEADSFNGNIGCFTDFVHEPPDKVMGKHNSPNFSTDILRALLRSTDISKVTLR